MASNAVQVPTLAGLVINEIAHKAVDRVRPLMPLLALALTVVLCAVPVAQVWTAAPENDTAVE